MKLIRADAENGLFSQLKSEWDHQLRSSEDAPSDYYEPMMGHAEKIVSESPQDQRYGIFVLVREGERGNTFDGMVHINHMLPRTSEATLRLVWNLLAPRYEYDFELEGPTAVAKVTAGFIIGALDLAVGKMASHAVKMYLGNAIDREHATGVALGLRHRGVELEVAVKGNWLHITHLSCWRPT